MATGSELSINTSASAFAMANSMFGAGVTVVGASYTGASSSSGIYSGGLSTSPGVIHSNSGVILSTGRASDFTQSSGDPNRSTQTTTDTSGPNNVPQFNAIAGTNTYDASYLDVDFIPTGDIMSIRFVFSSEEYPEYSSSIYNDLFIVYINGAPVSVPFGSGKAGVTNINPGENPDLFKSNTGDQFNTEMDGFTVELTLDIPVNSGQVNSIRIGIVDVSDARYDSNVLIAGDSIQTRLVAVSDALVLNQTGTATLDVLSNDKNFTGGTVTVTKINGVDVVPGQSVVLTTGQVVTLNPDMTFAVTGDDAPGEVTFTYGITSSTGGIDTGYVTLTTVPCFVAGTLVLTALGERPVEDLAPGDLVMTLDHGLQPVRWVGRRRIAATGRQAPVRIAAGTFGAHRRLLLSPQHRILVRDIGAELMFGEAEVLVAAKDLVNGRSIVAQEGGTVDYLHLLFDRHEVIWAEGLAAESFLPGPMTLVDFDAAARRALAAALPQVDPATGAGYGPAARRMLRAHEVQALFARPREIAA